MVWYSHLSKSFPQLVMIYTVKDFSVVVKINIFERMNEKKDGMNKYIDGK